MIYFQLLYDIIKTGFLRNFISEEKILLVFCERMLPVLFLKEKFKGSS
jgi:hypothetical protein